MSICNWCGEDGGDITIPHITADRKVEPALWHSECFRRSMIGGVNHLKGTCTCHGGTDPPDPPSLTRRQAALEAVRYWEMSDMQMICVHRKPKRPT